MKIKKKLLLFSLLLLFLLMGALYLTCKFIIPAQIKDTIEDRLGEGLKREVNLKRVNFNLFEGIELHHLLVYEPGKEEKIFLKVEELKIDYLLGEVLDNLREKGKNFREWQLTLKVSSPEVIFRGFRLENLELPLRMEGSQLVIEDLRADIYGGSLNASLDLNLVSEEKDFQFQGTFFDVDLARAGKDTGFFGEKEIKGILKASFYLRGRADNWKSFSGHGEVSIVRGEIGEFPFPVGLMPIFRLPSLKKAIFRQMLATFTISEGIIATEDLTLIGDQVKLLGRGKIDFQGYFRPSLVYKMHFSRGFLEKLPLIGNIISSIIDEVGHLIVQVEVTGSLKEPQRQLIPLAKGIGALLERLERSGPHPEE